MGPHTVSCGTSYDEVFDFDCLLQKNTIFCLLPKYGLSKIRSSLLSPRLYYFVNNILC